jgi:hypothetical protein
LAEVQLHAEPQALAEEFNKNRAFFKHSPDSIRAFLFLQLDYYVLAKTQRRKVSKDIYPRITLISTNFKNNYIF